MSDKKMQPCPMCGVLLGAPLVEAITDPEQDEMCPTRKRVLSA